MKRPGLSLACSCALIGLALVAFVVGLVGLTNNERASAQVALGLRQVPLGYQQITSLSTAQSLTVPTGATLAVITAEAQAVRYRDDGTAPSATVGMPLAVGTALVYSGTLSAISFIEQTSGAKLNILYYRVQ